MWCRNCNWYIEVVVINNVIIVDRCVNFREMFKGFGYCFYVERYEIKVNIVMFFKVVLVLFMKIYDWFYVYFVKCC